MKMVIRMSGDGDGDVAATVGKTNENCLFLHIFAFFFLFTFFFCFIFVCGCCWIFETEIVWVIDFTPVLFVASFFLRAADFRKWAFIVFYWTIMFCVFMCNACECVCVWFKRVSLRRLKQHANIYKRSDFRVFFFLRLPLLIVFVVVVLVFGDDGGVHIF